jgi:hypothetical protein
MELSIKLSINPEKNTIRSPVDKIPSKNIVFSFADNITMLVAYVKAEPLDF